MKLHIAPPDTQMARDVLAFAQYAADTLDKTQFVVMERRTWERLMPTNAPARDPARDERRNTADHLGHAVAVVAAQEPQAVDNDEVVCPNCVHQFRAIPVNVQALLRSLGAEPPYRAAPPPAAEGRVSLRIDQLECVLDELDLSVCKHAACRKAGRALGHDPILTYTLPEEGGASLRAAGFTLDKRTAGNAAKNWHNRPGRKVLPVGNDLIGGKWRWVA